MMTGLVSGYSSSMALLFLLGMNVAMVDAIASNFQSGQTNGALYAGGMDISMHNIFATGISYATNAHDPSMESMCFVSKFRNAHDTVSGVIGTGSTMNSCHTIGVLHDPANLGDKSTDIVVAGTNDVSGGFLFDVEPTMDNFQQVSSKFTVHQSENFGVSYPSSIRFIKERDENGNDIGDSIFLSSLSSENNTPNPGNTALLASTQNQPNWLKYYMVGNGFEMRVQKFNSTIQKGKTLIEEAWRSDFAALNDSNGQKVDVFLGGMLDIIRSDTKRPSLLVVAGSTAGSGKAFGQSQSGSNDEDGFLTVLMASDGTLRRPNPSIRVGTSATDLIMGICADPTDHKYFYIVGSTGDPSGMGSQIRHEHMVLSAADGSLHGFIQKRDLKTLQRQWGVTWGAKRYDDENMKVTTAGLDCKVTSDGNLYVAGIVENSGHVMRDPKEPVFGNNIVAMSLKTENGDVNWVQQHGSLDGDENLARGGGIAMKPATEDMILYGDTTGSLFRNRSGVSDNLSNIFFVTLKKANGNLLQGLNDAGNNQAHQAGLTDSQLAHEAQKAQQAGVPPSEMMNQLQNKAQGMLSGGDWKDDEVYGHSDWFKKNGMGVQSGPTNGSVFAGGMVYDPVEDASYMTGIAYEDHGPESKLSSCMITKLSLDPQGFHGWNSATGKVLGQNDILEVCSNVALHGYSELLSIGNADVGSKMLGVNAEAMVGFAMALDRNTLEGVGTKPLTNKWQPHKHVEYPVEILTDGNDIYIVSLISNNIAETREFKQVMSNQDEYQVAPNWINMQKYGSSFFIGVTKITLRENEVDGVNVGNIRFKHQWTKNLVEHPFASPVFLGGAILNKANGYLAVSGSTKAGGDAYGAQSASEDLFVTLLDMKTGEFSTSVQKSTMRKGTDKDSSVLGMCHDPDDDSSFYVVGATKGLIGKELSNIKQETSEHSTHAFILKVNANSLATEWIAQLGAIHKNSKTAPTTSKAFDCAVKGDALYLAGVVDDGAAMMQGHTALNSRGGDDVWLGRFDTKQGNVTWLRQMGSAGNDHLAPRGAIAINKQGNVILFGDTDGEFFREHSEMHKTYKINELFLLEVTKDGAFKPHVNHQKHDEIDPDVAAPAPTPVPKTTAPPFLVDQSKVEKEPGLSTGAKVALSFLGIASCLVLGVFISFSLKKRGRESIDTSQIQVKDGLFTDTPQDLAKAPPSSSFQQTVEPQGFTDNLQIEDKDII